MKVTNYIDSTRECLPQKHQKTTPKLPKKQQVTQGNKPKQSSPPTEITGQQMVQAFQFTLMYFGVY